jgi:hypothetical protein
MSTGRRSSRAVALSGRRGRAGSDLDVLVGDHLVEVLFVPVLRVRECDLRPLGDARSLKLTGGGRIIGSRLEKSPRAEARAGASCSCCG